MDARYDQFWRVLHGLFGASLTAKYGATLPPEWEQVLRPLTNEQLKNGLEKLTLSGAKFVPSLPELVQMCRDSREFDSTPANALPGKVWSRWEMAGNNHLLAYVFKQARAGRHFNAEQTRIMVRHKNAWVEDCEAHAAEHGEVPTETQRQWWGEMLERFEDQLRGGFA